eukprot:TRINITY_DN1846_c0_g1_i1.p1 TRINITY_DN1846_c0_g1~~TRINITY_DN1846_c0_g1_i1.p1  ORF type:complete len:479 (-),score=119.32 TRINITY_DN1846_c0_g1_i1:803-2209(-)
MLTSLPVRQVSQDDITDDYNTEQEVLLLGDAYETQPVQQTTKKTHRRTLSSSSSSSFSKVTVTVDTVKVPSTINEHDESMSIQDDEKENTQQSQQPQQQTSQQSTKKRKFDQITRGEVDGANNPLSTTSPEDDKEVERITLPAQQSSSGAKRRMLVVFTEEQQDQLDAMKGKELDQAINYDPEKPFYQYRRPLVDWMSDVAAELKLPSNTTHVAISYLDNLLASVCVLRDRLQMVSLCCLTLASKFLEVYQLRCIDVKDFLGDDEMDLSYLVEMEHLILNKLDWRMKVITTMDFLPFFLTASVANASPLECNTSSKRLRKYAKRYSEFFTEISIQDHTFLQYPPSHVCISTFICARRAMKMDSEWNHHMEMVSGYSYSEVIDCAEKIWNLYCESFPSENSNNTTVEAKATPIAITDMDQAVVVQVQHDDTTLVSSPSTTYSSSSSSSGGSMSTSASMTSLSDAFTSHL